MNLPLGAASGRDAPWGSPSESCTHHDAMIQSLQRLPRKLKTPRDTVSSRASNWTRHRAALDGQHCRRCRAPRAPGASGFGGGSARQGRAPQKELPPSIVLHCDTAAADCAVAGHQSTTHYLWPTTFRPSRTQRHMLQRRRRHLETTLGITASCHSTYVRHKSYSRSWRGGALQMREESATNLTKVIVRLSSGRHARAPTVAVGSAPCS